MVFTIEWLLYKTLLVENGKNPAKNIIYSKENERERDLKSIFEATMEPIRFIAMHTTKHRSTKQNTVISQNLHANT